MTISFITASVSGVGTYFRSHNLARALTLLGHRVRVFSVDQNPRSYSREEVRDGVEYHITSAFRGQSIFSQEHHPIVALVRSFESYGTSDVVHVFEPLLITYLPWRRIALKRAVERWYDWCDLWADGGLCGSRRRGGLRQRWAYECVRHVEHHAPRHANGVSVISEFLASEARNRGARRTVLLRNGVWPVTRIPKDIAREKFALDLSAIYLGFMGRTISGAELQWCANSLLAARSDGHDVRLALCGMSREHVQSLPKEARNYIDYIGQISETEASTLSMGLDLGLLPLEDNLFNISRVPVKLTSYLSSGTTVVVSEVGDCAQLVHQLPGVIGAGKGCQSWIKSVRLAIEQHTRGELPPASSELTTSIFSWAAAGTLLCEAYRVGTYK